MTKSTRRLINGMLLVCLALLLAAPVIEAASRLTTARVINSDTDQARTTRKRRSRTRRRTRRSTPQSNTNVTTEAVKPAATSQPVIRVYNPAEDAPPPVRPTPTPGMRNP